VILGFMVSSKKPDLKHPFGHGRAELISSVIIATLLAVVGFSFLMESIQRFRNHQAAAYNLIAVVIFVISVILKEALAQFSIILGKKNKSRSLIADGWHHRSDSIASGLVLIGMAAGKYIWWIDSVMGIAVSVLIFYAASDILKGSISLLIGEEPDDDFRSILKKIINESGLNDESIHHIHVHRYGEHAELTFHLRLPPKMSLNEVHSIADKLENKIRETMNIETTIHVEPVFKTMAPSGKKVDSPTPPKR